MIVIYFAKKSTTSMICCLGCFVSQNCHLLIMKPCNVLVRGQCYRQIKVNKITFFFSTPDSFHMTQRMGITNSVAQDGFIHLLFEFLSVRQIGQMCIPSTRLFPSY